jgi:hypothetical protein
MDGGGVAHDEVSDLAVFTCVPGACSYESDDTLLGELGLLNP